MKKLIQALGIFLIPIGFINFFTFMADNQRLGGSALSGYQRDGHFFVSERGRNTEVSESDWQNNRWHGMSLFVTHPLFIVAMAYLVVPKAIFRGRTEERERKEQVVRSLSSPQTSFSCAGGIGYFNFNGPILKVTVYSQGIHCKPIFMPAFGILSSEISSVTTSNSFLKKGVEIAHTSPEVVTPIFLCCADDNVAVSALTALKA